MREITHSADLCVVGGGLSGTCAAIAAARHGLRVVLMQDRPMLGGNASSEIRMWICGCGSRNGELKETGILEELELENFYRNDNRCYQVWDTVIYEKAYCEENITLLLNTTCQSVEMDGDRIVSVRGWQMTSETYHTVSAALFADCSGDSVLAPLTGAEFRLGREARSEFGESIAPETADRKTMGLSCMFQIRETDRKQKFIPPEWAYRFTSDDDIPLREHHIGTNYWWIEIGGERDSIHDTDDLRHELLRISYGVWDHVKNHGDHGADNWVLDWIGFLPGKRESRRYVGDYIVNQNDVGSGGHFDDIVAYGGWTMDDHFPEGFWYRGGYPTIHHPAPTPWGIPWRALYSKNIANLGFAGRNISVTHTAMSSSRVMATCCLCGQALGTGVALAVKSGASLRNIDVGELRRELMLDDCYIPYHERELSPLTASAKTNADIVRNGVDRSLGGDKNYWAGHSGDRIVFEYDAPVDVGSVRLVFDSELTRGYHNMPSNYPLREDKYKLPKTLVRDYDLICEGEGGELFTAASVTDNRRRLVFHSIGKKVRKVIFAPKTTWGCEEFRVFAVDVL